MGIEDPDEDVLEQQQAVEPDAEDEPADEGELGSVPLEADPADVAEQGRVYPDDEY
ncbi:hypothetical protein [Pseudonocardia asaccharolytica]|uniref:Uncharacterized protein n=1 Tax=Pseudonocardia asaccharolytica DSM 44247 = NBRC 16224 TaxID=1123024 RepID=A0A511D5T5_9PSEU|nr:hypothetical protein [Pseudonocardia asaccharolytica]GEL20152.1 hypothetical protein PA7_39890 [Pseudonocardia asaccharolytica DSM 44247 = NBRC 16224]